MPLYIKDDITAGLVTQLAQARGITKQDAVKLAVQAELDRMAVTGCMQDRLKNFWALNPPAEPTGEPADKAFFDALSGDL